jgi:type II secretory pathway component PulJ
LKKLTNYNAGYTLVENLVSLSLISVILFPLVLFFIRQERMILKLKRDLEIERVSYEFLLNQFNKKAEINMNDTIYDFTFSVNDGFETFELMDKKGKTIFEKKIIR